ncbi:MAG: hypothetical protein HOW73_46510 [Polyangiaceae bacterium]|nr:hypothetical protein [Polyangiaceae bacterium]
MHDFYTGFEGEAEVRFVLRAAGTDQRIVRLWIGYFDTLMETVQPENGEWTGLALPYHVRAGWYDQSPWRVENLNEVLEQWRRIPTFGIDPQCERAYRAVLDLLTEAANTGSEVWIEYD